MNHDRCRAQGVWRINNWVSGGGISCNLHNPGLGVVNGDPGMCSMPRKKSLYIILS